MSDNDNNGLKEAERQYKHWRRQRMAIIVSTAVLFGLIIYWISTEI